MTTCNTLGSASKKSGDTSPHSKALRANSKLEDDGIDD